MFIFLALPAFENEGFDVSPHTLPKEVDLGAMKGFMVA